MKKTILVVLMMIACCVLAAAADVKLAWDASASANIAGYRLYYGPASKAYTASVTTPNLTHTLSLPSGKYYFAVTAYDANGNESDYSNEVSTIVKPDAPVNLHFENMSVTIAVGGSR